jgi:hypothetical protein
MNRKYLVALVLIGAFTLFASQAFAGIIVNVLALPGSGYSVDASGKAVTVTDPGAVVKLGVFATVSGTNATATDDGLWILNGALVQTHVNTANGTGALGLSSPDVPWGALSPFDQATQHAPAPVTADSIGIAGSTTTDTLITYKAAAIVNNTTLGQTYQLGTFNYAAQPIHTPAGGVFSSINWANSGAGTALQSFKIDGTPKNGLAASLALITSGAPVTCAAPPIPEPATLVLLGMGALALVFIRRRK